MTLLKALSVETKELNLAFDFTEGEKETEKWGQIAKSADVAEAVCKCLLANGEPSANGDSECAGSGWRQILIDNPSLITESWGGGGGTHQIHGYRDDGMYVFNKKNIASGGIPLNLKIHERLQRIEDLGVAELNGQLKKFNGFYICYSGNSANGGVFANVKGGENKKIFISTKLGIIITIPATGDVGDLEGKLSFKPDQAGNNLNASLSWGDFDKLDEGGRDKLKQALERVFKVSPASDASAPPSE